MRILIAIVVCAVCGYGMCHTTLKQLHDSMVRCSNVLTIAR